MSPSHTARDDNDPVNAGSSDARSSSGQPALPEAMQIAAATTSAEKNSRHDGPAPMEIEATAAWSDACSTAILCDPIGAGAVLCRGEIVNESPAGKGRGWRSIGQKFNHPEAQFGFSRSRGRGPPIHLSLKLGIRCRRKLLSVALN